MAARVPSDRKGAVQMADRLARDHVSAGFDLTGVADIDGHEAVWTCHDPASGLKAIVALHSTVLGPALGGTRFMAYPDDDSALRDVLRLSEGMTYKAAAAGLDHGGGKAVIVGDPHRLRSADLLLAYGRFVEDLGGAYITAADVGTGCADMDVIARSTSNVVGRSREAGGSGDSGVSTAIGVYRSMRAAVAVRLGADCLDGLRVGVEGAGKVGSRLVAMLVADGARVLVADPAPRALEEFRQMRNVTVVPSLDGLDLDVYAPCALGATLTEESVGRLKARVVCGAANNQLATDAVDQALADRDIVWVPDYVANAGGLIQVAAEAAGQDDAVASRRIDALGDRVLDLLAVAAAERIPTGAAARLLVDRRLSPAG